MIAFIKKIELDYQIKCYLLLVNTNILKSKVAHLDLLNNCQDVAFMKYLVVVIYSSWSKLQTMIWSKPKSFKYDQYLCKQLD